MRPKQFLLYYELEYRKCFDASKSSGKSTQTLQSISKKITIMNHIMVEKISLKTSANKWNQIHQNVKKVKLIVNRKHNKLPKISPIYSVKFCFTAVLKTTIHANSSLHSFHPVSLQFDFVSQPPMVCSHTGKWMWKPSKLKCIEEPCRWKATMLMLRARVDPRVLPVSSWGTGTVIIEKCKTKQGAEPSSLASGAACKDLWNLIAFCWICWVWCIFVWIGCAGCGRCGIRFASVIKTSAQKRSVATPWVRRNVSKSHWMPHHETRNSISPQSQHFWNPSYNHAPILAEILIQVLFKLWCPARSANPFFSI